MTAHYLLPCSCGQKVRVAVAQAGGEVGCACGKQLAIPTLRGIRQLEIASDAPTKAAPIWTRIHGTVFAMGLILATLSIALIAFNAFRYAQLSGFAVDRTEDWAKEYSGELDSISPADALALWQKEILEEGLGEAHQPIWVTAKARLEESVYRIWVGIGAFAASVIAIVLSLFVGRK